MKQPSNEENHPWAAHPLDEPLTKHRFTSNMVVAYGGVPTLQYWESSALWHESNPQKLSHDAQVNTCYHINCQRRTRAHDAALHRRNPSTDSLSG